MMINTSLFAQDWVKMMQDRSVNFFDVQKAFYKQYGAKEKEMMRERLSNAGKQVSPAAEEENEIPGYSQFKRWEWFMAPRVSATGERFDPTLAWKEVEKYRSTHNNRSMTIGAGNWSFIGPNNTSALAGAGRLNFVRIHPT